MCSSINIRTWNFLLSDKTSVRQKNTNSSHLQCERQLLLLLLLLLLRGLPIGISTDDVNNVQACLANVTTLKSYDDSPTCKNEECCSAEASSSWEESGGYVPEITSPLFKICPVRHAGSFLSFIPAVAQSVLNTHQTKACVLWEHWFRLQAKIQVKSSC